MKQVTKRIRVTIKIALGSVLITLITTVLSWVIPSIILASISKVFILITIGIGAYLVGLAQAQRIIERAS